jgi:tetratricopeptide (TPR) repeat protein
MPTKLSRFSDGLMEAGWLAAIILVPLFFNVYSSRIFEPDKITLLRSIALLVLAAWLTKLIETFRSPQEGPGPVKTWWKRIIQTPMLPPALALIVVYLLSTLVSVTFRVSLLGSYQRLQGTYTTFSYLVIFFAIAANLRKPAQIERLITTVALVSLPIGLYGILQRYKIDPIPWGGDVSERIASNMGNSIFVAAYLIMAFPFTMSRVLKSFKAILNEENQVFPEVVRGTIYVFTAAIQVIALYMSGSRGPALGWMISTVFMLLLLSRFWRKRWITHLIIGVGVAALAFLVVFNLPNGPLESLKESSAIGRFGSLLDEQSNSAKVRQYIWEGAVKLFLPHDPIQYPDGSQDTFNIIRPLLGYGPESMYVAYNPFYPPLLGTVEKRNASPDRSHNETWDSLIITGIAGLLVYLSIFTSCFYYGLKWLHLIQGANQKRLFFLILFSGTVLGALSLSLWRGLEYLGLGIPLGFVLGLFSYLVLSLVFFKNDPMYAEGDSYRAFVIIFLLTAILAHLIEINFGIAIVATRTYFWAFSGLLLVAGHFLRQQPELAFEHAPAAAEVSHPVQITSKPDAKAKAKRRKVEKTSPAWLINLPEWFQETLIGSGLISIVMVTLGYNFISNGARATSATQILANSFSRLPNKGNVFSLGVLAFILTTWVALALVFTSENPKAKGIKSWLQTFLSILGITAAVILIYWLWLSSTLASIASFAPTNVQQVLDQVDQIAGLLTKYYFYLFLLMVGIAFALTIHLMQKLQTASPAGAIFAPISLIVVALLVSTTNLRVIHADISYKMAESFTSGNQWPVATLLYQNSLELTPNEDFYYLFLGRSFLEQAKGVKDQAELDKLVKEAEMELKKAQQINPLNTDHTANLGRLYSWYASQAQDPVVRNERGEISSKYYSAAVKLSPQNSTLWGEWAILMLEILNKPEEAVKILEHTIQVDPYFTWTQSLMGNYYLRQSQAITDTVKKTALLEKALGYFDTAVSIVNSYPDPQIMYNAMLSQADTLRQLNRSDRAIEVYQKVLKINPGASNAWKIRALIAQMYAQKGDKANALIFATDALNSAPDDQKGPMESFIKQIQALP